MWPLLAVIFYKKLSLEKEGLHEVSKHHINLISIIERCQKNDRSAQSRLYYWLYGFAMKICYRYTPSVMESEELTNESFLKLFKNISQFDTFRQVNTEALLKAWFKRIIINTCIDHLRKHHTSFSHLTVAEENEASIDSQETGISKLAYKEIIQAIRQLTPAYRAVFNLFVIEGLSHEEIASLLSISVGASKSNLSKARHKLRKILTEVTEYHNEYAAS